MPKVIKRQRTKGWRMPEGAVYVGRPSAYGNLYRLPVYATREDRVQALKRYRDLMESLNTSFSSLRGKDLVCWCVDWDPADGPAPGVCHAEILLELANR